MKIHVPILNKYYPCIFRWTHASIASRLMAVVSYIGEQTHLWYANKQG